MIEFERRHFEQIGGDWIAAAFRPLRQFQCLSAE
jgi:hypothetical protein